MGDFFSAVADKAGQGVQWGASMAAKGASAAKEFGVQTVKTTIQTAVKAKDATVDAYHQTTKAVGDTYQAGKDLAAKTVTTVKQAALDLEGKVISNVAGGLTKTLVNDHKRLQAVRTAIDGRDRFSTTIIEPCPNKDTSHPDKRDGQYMGADCPAVHEQKPAAGTKPHKFKTITNADGKPERVVAGTCDGKSFPRVVFTNGINNDPQQVCDTMHAIADSRCVEVTAVFNATYADKTLKTSPRSEPSAITKAVAESPGFLQRAGSFILNPVGSAMQAGRDLGNSIKDKAIAAATDKLQTMGLVQDVIDCINAIDKSSTDAASKTLAKEIVQGLNGNPPQMTMYAHSQGGLNLAAGITLAKDEMVKTEIERLTRAGQSASQAKITALANTEAKLRNLEVSTFGTLERGLPDGPKYHRYTNDYDPVPKIIQEAQSALAQNDVANEPKGAAPTVHFARQPGIDPISAHGMAEAYLPHLDKILSNGECC